MVRIPLLWAGLIRAPAALVAISLLHGAVAPTPTEVAAASSGESGPGTMTATPLADRGSPGPTRFQLIEASQTGVDFTIYWSPPEGFPNRGIGSTGSAGGVSIGDYDEDGRPDLFVTRPFGGNRLYRNLGDFRFADVTEQAGLDVELEYDAWGAGPCFVDIDSDGDLDLYVCSHRRANRLYINQGDGTFVDRAREHGLDFSGASVTMAFADYDLDGDLDAYLVTNWLIPDQPTKTQSYAEFRDGRMRVSKEYHEEFDVLKLQSGRLKVFRGAQLDHFYRNDRGTFVEATRQVLGDYSAAENFFGHAARWLDYDDDGYPDLYISNDFYGPDQLFHNNGDGTLSDVTKTALPHVPWFSMGSDAGDVNNDGRLDLMASDMAFTTHEKYHTSRGDVPGNAWFLDISDPKQQMANTLYINTGTPRFLEAASLAGVSNTDWTWAIKFGDFDNDGRIDLYITNGMTRNWFDSDVRTQARLKTAQGADYDEKWESLWQHQPPLREKNVAFRNRGDLRFEQVAAPWGLGFEGVSFGSALGDLDGDGDLDIVTVNFENQAHIYRNQGGENHRVALKLIGTHSNRMGIGAVVTVETDDGLQVRDFPSVRGFMSADEPKVHFGLGRADVINRLTIRWPSGTVQTFANLPADRLYTITEPADGGVSPPAEAPAEPMFAPRHDLPQVVHVEQPFDDFAVERLLPKRLSQLGPGIGCADVNGDGHDDFYLAGANGAIGQLLLGDGTGFVKDTRSDAAFGSNWSSEEMAPLLFDADGDGDQDLYLVNGGVEHVSSGDDFHDLFFLDDTDGSNHDRLQDRLLLNDGAGTFVPAPDDALPEMPISGGAVAASDFDRDGDLDLFVGGRIVPGDFPLAPPSVLLRNDGGKFVDVTKELAPGLADAGMVTSALWSDADGDGWCDLLVTCEWGPVKLWRNDNGQLRDVTPAAGLAARTGWWNGIAAGDLDHDGDIDYVLTNFGLNTPYQATDETPAVMLSGDMDDDGTSDIIEAELTQDGLLPVRDKTSLTDAMPILAEEWSTFERFAKSNLVDLFGQDRLRSAIRLEATTLASGILLNDGRGRFEFHALPRIAQVSPGFGCAIVDVDADGNNDVYLVQNFYHPQRNTTRMDGGVSQLLLGDGKGGLRPVPPHESGLVVPGDARALCVTDLNHDGRPDFLVTVNNGELSAFENHVGNKNRTLALRLIGRPGNPTAIGARVVLALSDGTRQLAEVHCGGGYLSQSSSTLFFGLGAEGQAQRVAVRWPDGSQNVFPVDSRTTTLTLEQPDR